MNRAMIVVDNTVPILRSSIRAINHERTSGLIPSGTSTLAPYPASNAPVNRRVRTGFDVMQNLTPLPAVHDLFQQDRCCQYQHPTKMCLAKTS